MLTRKQQWRRVKCRPMHNKNPVELYTAVTVQAKKKSLKGVDVAGQVALRNDNDSDDSVSTTTVISTWSSFDSVDSMFTGEHERQYGEEAGGALRLQQELSMPLSLPAMERPTVGLGDASHLRGSNKGVTFEPTVQVFLVTHKSELDSRAKQALWWTGRDAAMNKRAWLNHLGQPGCGRQSVARRQLRQHQQITGQGPSSSSHLFGTSGVKRSGGLSARSAGIDVSPGNGSSDEVVGILGCRCQACLTEGDEHDHAPPPSRQQQALLQQRFQQQHLQQQQRIYNHQARPQQQYNPYASAAAVYGGGYCPAPAAAIAAAAAVYGGKARASSKSWPSPHEWERQDALEEKGSRSYSPASSLDTSPMRDADEGGVFPAGAYFWDRE